MRQLVRGRGGHDDRVLERNTKGADAKVPAGCVDEDPRSEADTVPRRAVVGEAELVAGAPRLVVPGARFDPRAGERLVVGDRDRAVGIGHARR
jgi:hypothetical protein